MRSGAVRGKLVLVRMRLSLKLSFFTALGILMVLGCDGYLRVQREVRLFADQQQRDQHVLAHVLSLAAQAAADRSGERRALQLLRDVNLRESDVEISWEADPLHVLRETHSRIAEDRATGRRTLITRKPLNLAHSGQLVLRQSLSREDQYLSNTALGAIRVSALLVALSTAIIFAVGWWLLGVPLRLLVAGARRIGAGELATRLSLSRRDEMGELAREMNLMCEQLAASRELAIEQAERRANTLERMAQAERWTTLGKLAVGLSQALAARAHQIRARSGLLQARVAADGGQGELEAIVEQAEQLESALQRVSTYAGSVGGVRQPHDLNAIVRTAVDLVGHAGHERGVEIEVVEDAGPVWIVGRAAQLQQLAINLLLNAIEAMPQGGRASIGAHRDCRPFVRSGLKIGPSHFVCLVVEDDGVGMNQETQARMFEPMFTTREAGHATGLGLTAVAAIVEEHRGFVDVASDPGLGTRIAVFLQNDMIAGASEVVRGAGS
jgi:two-component system NtrC family sensor kinase